MYKDRLRKWGVGKNVKSHEKEAVIRKQLQRSRVGKSTAYSIRGSQILEHKIKRYQKATKLISQEQAPQLRTGTPPGLICYTPLASPLSTPAILETPERVAKDIQSYVDGCLSSGLWKLTDGDWLVTTKVTRESSLDFFYSCSYAVNQFSIGEVKGAWRLLNLAMGLVERTVLEECPHTLEFLIRSVFWFTDWHHLQGITNVLLTQFSAMSATIKPKEHPFNKILPRLVGQDIPELKHTLAIALQSHVDSFDETVGHFSWNAVKYQSTLLQTSSDREGCTKSFCEVLQELEQALGESDERCLFIRLGLSWSYYLSEQPRKAAEVARSVVRLESAQQSTDQILTMQAHDCLAQIHYQLSETDLAEQSLRQSILIQIDNHGREEYRVLDSMSFLGSWLEEWGRVDEAEEIRKQADDVLDTKYEKFAVEEEERFQRLQISPEL